MLSYERLSKKPLLFKSFTAGLTVHEFDNIYNKKIIKKHHKYEIKRLSKRKKKEKEKVGAWKTFQTKYKKQISNAFGLLSSLHYLHPDRLSLGFRSKQHMTEISKRLNIEYRQCVPIPQKIYNNNKEVENARRSRDNISQAFLLS